MNYAGGGGQRDCSALFVNVFVHKMAPKTNSWKLLSTSLRHMASFRTFSNVDLSIWRFSLNLLQIIHVYFCFFIYFIST